MRTLYALMAAGAFAMAAPAASAHGDEKHGTKPGAAATISGEEHAFGKEGDPKLASRTVTIDMSDEMRFTPSDITVKPGETVTFVVANKGQVLHEMVIGTEEELLKHAELMRKNPDMEHDEPYMAHVKAGGREQITWQFTKAGTFAFACLVPGHYEAGMKGRIVVGLASTATTTDGEVRKVDVEAKKITLKHGAIANLDMPPMTMVFRVADVAMLGNLKPGDFVRFAADRVDGAITITAIELRP